MTEQPPVGLPRRRLPVPKRRNPARSAFLLLVLALAAACNGAPPSSSGAPEAEGSDVRVAIRGAQVAVDVAADAASQRKGLGYREGLDWGRGMLFVYERLAFHRFWMKGMSFPIDIVWIRDGRIIFIAHRVPHEPGVPDRELRTYQPPEAADQVLEVPAGFAEAHGWRRGDAVQIEGRL